MKYVLLVAHLLFDLYLDKIKYVDDTSKENADGKLK